jgi:hypothetical protein
MLRPSFGAGSVLAVVACAQPHVATPTPSRPVTAPPPTGLEYGVYTTVLDSLFGTSAPYILLIAESTVAVMDPQLPAAGRRAAGTAPPPHVFKDAYRDFRRKNREAWALVDSFHLARPVQLVRYSETATWPRHAVGPIIMSRVGLSCDSARAIVYIEWFCGSLCGEGHAWFLTRGAGNRWAVTERRRLWTS